MTGKSSRGRVDRLKRERAGDDLHLAFGGGQFDLAAFGQFADDLEKGVCGDGGGAGLRHLGGNALVDLQVEVGRHQPQRAVVARLDEDVGQDGDGVAALDHRLDMAEALQQGRPLDRRLHVSPFARDRRPLGRGPVILRPRRPGAPLAMGIVIARRGRRGRG